jgi:hypothetical protein
MKIAFDEVNKFASIKDAYKYVEENIQRLEANHDVKNFWVDFRNKTNNAEEKQLAQWELECFLFHIAGDKVFSFSYSTGEEPGEVYEYPKLDSHQTKAFEYLEKRANDAKSPVLKARFNHLLWRAVKGVKNRVYAAKAIDEYFNILDPYKDLSYLPNEDDIRMLTKKCESLVSAVAETKLRVSDTVQIFRHLILNITNLKFYIKHSMLDIMLKYPSVFKRNAYADLLSIFDGEIEISGNEKSDDFMMAKYYLPTAIKIASKLGQNPGEWDSRIGECYVRMGDKETDPERNWLKLQDYALAIQHFKQAGNVVKRQEVENKYAVLKDDVTLPTTVIEYTDDHIAQLKAFEDEIKEKTTKLLTLPSDSIYEIIGRGGYFPTNQFITDTARETTESWMDGITLVKFDINKNIESISESKDDSDGWMFQYKYHIRHSVSPYLYYTLIPGIRSGVLTYKNFISYLSTHTWLGYTLTKKDLGGEVIKYNWIAMVAPSIVEYFLQMESSLSSQEYKPNFILAIDSLTIKFEGLFREFCTRINTPTSTSTKKSMQEMYLHQLLQQPSILNFFSEEDRVFFEFLFTKENGLNLRNNIAHCYSDFSDYSYSYFHLLIAALLRLGKYKFKIATKEN